MSTEIGEGERVGKGCTGVSANESRPVRIGKKHHRHKREGGEKAATRDRMRAIRYPGP